jgi:hypothetical protein
MHDTPFSSTVVKSASDVLRLHGFFLTLYPHSRLGEQYIADSISSTVVFCIVAYTITNYYI